jgi:predicted  nucleic acid-binding Zn-ribbon protein
MSDTPRTNSKWEELCCSGQSWYTIAEYMKEDCQDLERELTAARDELADKEAQYIEVMEGAYNKINKIDDKLKAVTEQCDRLAEALKKWNQYNNEISNHGSTPISFKLKYSAEEATTEALQSLTPTER